MNETESSIYNCYSLEGLDGWEENMDSFNISDKKKKRYLQLIAKRREELKNGIRTEAPDARPTPFGQRTIAEQRRAKRWRKLAKVDEEGNVLLVGFARKPSSRKFHGGRGNRMLKEPVVLAKAPTKEKTNEKEEKLVG